MFNMLAGFSNTGWMTQGAARRAIIEAWSRPGAMTAMLNWYRASPIVVPGAGETGSLGADPRPAAQKRLPSRMPHLVVWGEDDRRCCRPA